MDESDWQNQVNNLILFGQLVMVWLLGYGVRWLQDRGRMDLYRTKWDALVRALQTRAQEQRQPDVQKEATAAPPVRCCDPTFAAARQLAEEAGLTLMAQTETHCQLIYQHDGQHWIYNLYPTTRKVYPDPHHKGPFLRVGKRWTLTDVVRAAIEAQQETAR
jgi:hypothetical protein